MKISKKLSVSVVTTGLLLAVSATSAFAGTTVTVSGNGFQSDNLVKVKNECSASVKQTNSTVALTNVVSVADTGNVKANGNTGGDTSVETGDAASAVTVEVTGSDNVANGPSCCECVHGDTDVEVKNNGAESDTDVKLTNKQTTKATQKSNTTALTGVDSKAKTGKVKANWNTGGGVDVVTGSSLSTVDVKVVGGKNKVK